MMRLWVHRGSGPVKASGVALVKFVVHWVEVVQPVLGGIGIELVAEKVASQVEEPGEHAMSLGGACATMSDGMLSCGASLQRFHLDVLS